MTLFDLQCWLAEHNAHCHIGSRPGRFLVRISRHLDWSERQNEDLETAVQECMDAFLGTFADLRVREAVSDGGTRWTTK